MRDRSNALPAHLLEQLKPVPYSEEHAATVKLSREDSQRSPLAHSPQMSGTMDTAATTGDLHSECGIDWCKNRVCHRLHSATEQNIMVSCPASLCTQVHHLLFRCAICLGDYTEGEDTITLPCGHSFHAPCVLEWLKRSRQCPLCKDDIAAHLEGHHHQ